MKQREFNKYLNACRNKTGSKLDLTKVAALPVETRTDMALWLIRNRGPVLVELLTPVLDPNWLASCGYLYTTTGKTSGRTFLHTCEHSIV